MKKTTKSHCFQVPTDVLSQAKIIGKQLKIARKKRSLPQADVAMRIGVTRDVVIKAEQGISVASHSLLCWMQCSKKRHRKYWFMVDVQRIG
jgi:transcriptional regulator with XRE-family HTH domain